MSVRLCFTTLLAGNGVDGIRLHDEGHAVARSVGRRRTLANGERVIVGSLHPWIGLTVGIAGLAIGVVGTNFALSVSPFGRLQWPTIALPVRGRRLSDVVCGSVAVALVWATLGTVLEPSAVTAMVCVCALIGVMLAIVDVRNRRLPFALTFALYMLSGATYVGEALATGDWADLFRAGLVGRWPRLAFSQHS